MTKSPSTLEEAMLNLIHIADLPEPTREFKALENRRFKWDFAWVEDRLLLEVQGGVWGRGGHSTGAGITKDCEKLALATINGWRTIQVTSNQIKDGSAILWISCALAKPGDATYHSLLKEANMAKPCGGKKHEKMEKEMEKKGGKPVCKPGSKKPC